MLEGASVNFLYDYSVQSGQKDEINIESVLLAGIDTVFSIILNYIYIFMTHTVVFNVFSN